MQEKFKVCKTYILGAGVTGVSNILENDKKDLVVLLSDVEQNKIGNINPMDTDAIHTELVFKNIEGLNVLLNRLKEVKKQLKKRNKYLGLCK